MTQVWQAEAATQAHNERVWSAPPGASSGQWDMYPEQQRPDTGASQGLTWPVVQEPSGQQQANAVPSAVQQRAAQYAGDEGLARPPTRPPSDWRSRQHHSHADGGSLVTTTDAPNQSSDRYVACTAVEHVCQARLEDIGDIPFAKYRLKCHSQSCTMCVALHIKDI